MKPNRLQLNKKRIEILEFAKEHNLLIDPAKGFEHQVENYFRFGYCPCDKTKTRTRCPCMESLVDIKESGHCLCRLYWKDIDTFKKLYEEKDEGQTTQKNHASSRRRRVHPRGPGLR